MRLCESVKEHYTKFLGEPSATYSVNLALHPDSHFHIDEYRERPWQGAVTLATRCLCSIPLHMFRQELMILCYDSYFTDQMVGLLATVAQIITEDNHPLLQGKVVGPFGPLLSNTSMEALYSTVPTYFPDEFQLVEGGEMPVDIGWLIPIYRVEAEWIEEHGWEAFEALLVEQDPDVMNLERESIV